MNVFMKIPSGSSRDKMAATPKQNKWADPFYCEARGNPMGIMLKSHKVDTLRAQLSGTINLEEPKGFFKMIGSAIRNFFSFNSRKGFV